MDLEDEWEMFLSGDATQELVPIVSGIAPSPSNLYISTNTVISFLNQPIDLIDTFWDISILPYSSYSEGVIKKQMKFNSSTEEEVNAIQEAQHKYEYNHEKIIQHIENKSGRIKYKDVRIVTIGISKKDVLSFRVKSKGAFYNCFALVMRVFIKEDKIFKEFHVKIFNTGKIEIPGIQNVKHIPYIIDILLSILKKRYPNIVYNKCCEETVLINSNFNCGYFINRHELYSILKQKYNISAVYDPCSYPGIQCKIYYDTKQVVTTIQPIEVSFMIFRTGSVLIVGKSSEHVIRDIYTFLSNILIKEYSNIVNVNCNHNKKSTLSRKSKVFILLS